MVVRDFRSRSIKLLNPLLFNKLRPRCISQQFFRDTATFVHTHPSEAA